MSPLLLGLLLGIVGPLLCGRVVTLGTDAPSPSPSLGTNAPSPSPSSPSPSPSPSSSQSGGGGKFATSLCAELIRPNGYTCTEHEVVTDDGFILGIENMPPRGQQTGPSGSVLLMHGLLAGGDNWVANSPQESLAFILADHGFNVWIGNNRAVQWSHGHQIYNPSEDAYWDWTYDELASYDLKALTGYVYNQTNHTKLIYIGHSQGTTMLLAGLTDGAFNTEVLGYLNSAVLLAPVAFVSHITAEIVAVGLRIYADVILAAVGDGEFNPNIFFNLTCTSPLINALACNDLYTGVLGQNSYLNTSRLAFYSQYYPQPTSSFNINHFGQSLRTNTFQFYDRGALENLDTYGTLEPPPYNLTTFPTSLPLQVWTGGIDGLGDPTDASATLSMLPSSNREVKTLPNYGHVDFIYGYEAYVDVYPDLILFLHEHF